MQAFRGGAEQGEVISVEQQSDGEAGKGGGSGIGSSDKRGHTVDVEAKEKGAQGAALLDPQVAGEGVSEARGGGGTGGDASIQ